MSGYARDRDGGRRPVEIPSHAFGISHSDGRYSRGRITSRRTHLKPATDQKPAEIKTRDTDNTDSIDTPQD